MTPYAFLLCHDWFSYSPNCFLSFCLNQILEPFFPSCMLIKPVHLLMDHTMYFLTSFQLCLSSDYCFNQPNSFAILPLSLPSSSCFLNFSVWSYQRASQIVFLSWEAVFWAPIRKEYQDLLLFKSRHLLEKSEHAPLLNAGRLKLAWRFLDSPSIVSTKFCLAMALSVEVPEDALRWRRKIHGCYCRSRFVFISAALLHCKS